MEFVIYTFQWMGKGVSYGGLFFPETGCPVPDAYFYYVPDVINVWILFLYLSSSLGCFRPRTLFSNNGLNNTEWAPFLSGLHTKHMIIYRVFPGFATCPPCGVWCRGWTTCLMYDGTLSGVWISKIKLVCNFGIVGGILFILFFICLCLSVF